MSEKCIIRKAWIAGEENEKFLEILGSFDVNKNHRILRIGPEDLFYVYDVALYDEELIIMRLALSKSSNFCWQDPVTHITMKV